MKITGQSISDVRHSTMVNTQAISKLEMLCQILLKLIDNIEYVLLASVQDQNDSIIGKYEIIPTRIVNFV
jgi:hypothetical protein